MIQFEMKRFLSVARWDMTINKKFYMSQVACLLALAVSPVVFQYLLWWSSGSISIFDFSGNTAGMNVPLKNTLDVGFFHVAVSSFIPIISLGYMFHNLVNKQGRIAELTLPASNAERFLWHTVFSLIAPMLVFGCSVLVADVVNLLFALLFGCLSTVTSLTYSWLSTCVSGIFYLHSSLEQFWWMFPFMTLSSLCYVSTFALGNAVKYRYNIILTWLAHMLFWVTLGLGSMFVFGLLMQILGRDYFSHLVIDINIDTPIWFALGSVLMLILLVGIWALTYWLYCRAQITTRRNR